MYKDRLKNQQPETMKNVIKILQRPENEIGKLN